jgi:hypothetical protein
MKFKLICTKQFIPVVIETMIEADNLKEAKEKAFGLFEQIIQEDITYPEHDGDTDDFMVYEYNENEEN